MSRLFGTDGIRGIVNSGLDAELAFKVGLATASVLSENIKGRKPVITLGRDTRLSGNLLKGALIAGMCTAGSDVLDLGIIPTPGVAWITVNVQADAGIVISASHNPFEHNGIKIFNSQGYKLSDELEDRIEDMVFNCHENFSFKTYSEIGQVFYVAEETTHDYIDHLVNTISEQLSGFHILVDCANGASYTTAGRLFERFPKLHTDIINADPDGININDKCGSTHLESLSAMVVAGKYDLGIAFDGDADRCLAIDERGNEIDGDKIMAICGLALKEQGKLPGNTIVATVMSNIGLHLFAKEHDLKLECTNVGDRNVLEVMRAKGYTLGGEQSGHMIFLEHATTGDGQLTALQILSHLQNYGKKASELFGLCSRYPQVLLNIPVDSNQVRDYIMSSPELENAIKEQEAVLQNDGRVLVRSSGTESLIRVMVEAKEKSTAQRCASLLADFVAHKISL